MKSTPTRQAILHLYKQCLKSAKRIPNPEQRLMYLEYVQDGFHRKKDLVAASPQALAAIYDAKDQLERMNYYHSIREMKEKEEMKKNQPRRHGGRQQHITRGGNEWNKEKFGERDQSKTSKGEKEKATIHVKQTTTPIGDDSRPFTNTTSLSSSSSTTASAERKKYDIVSNWLTSALPHLHSDDHTTYVQNLVQDGFDSVAMLEGELLEDDLLFMKKAHRRSLWKFISGKNDR